MPYPSLVEALRAALSKPPADIAFESLQQLARAHGFDEVAGEIRSVAAIEDLLMILQPEASDPFDALVRSTLTASDAPDVCAAVWRAIGPVEGLDLHAAIEDAAQADGSVEVDASIPALARIIAREAGDFEGIDAIIAAIEGALSTETEADVLDFEDLRLSALYDQALEPATARRVALRLGQDAAARETIGLWTQITRTVRDTIPAQAGSVDVWAEVARGIGLDEPFAEPGVDMAPVVAILKADAGEIDVAARVMTHLLGAGGGFADARPAIHAPEPMFVRHARSVLFWMGVCAAMVFTVNYVFTPEASSPDAAATRGFSDAPVSFASADEVQIEDISSGDLSVYPERPEQGEGLTIIWINGVRR